MLYSSGAGECADHVQRDVPFQRRCDGLRSGLLGMRLQHLGLRGLGLGLIGFRVLRVPGEGYTKAATGLLCAENGPGKPSQCNSKL